jgi:anti-sigma factor RsiW
MSEHVTVDQIEKLARRELPADSVLEVARHIGACSECAAIARDRSARSSAAALRAAFDLEDIDHPSVDHDLADFVNGTLTSQRRAAIETHLAECDRCREDVADLRDVSARMTRRVRPAVLAVAAALGAIGITLLLLSRTPRDTAARPVVRSMRRPINVTKPMQRPREWDEAVRAALDAGRLARPSILSELRPAPDVLRGPGMTTTAALAPIGEVIETATPRFEWTASSGAIYVVSVFNGEREVASSGEIKSATWSPAKGLARGNTYVWQVEVRRGDASTILPAPPDPQALFRVADEKTLREIAEARQRFPDDHLLLGVLYARAGMQERAKEELRADGSVTARRLLDSIHHW